MNNKRVTLSIPLGIIHHSSHSCTAPLPNFLNCKVFHPWKSEINLKLLMKNYELNQFSHSWIWAKETDSKNNYIKFYIILLHMTMIVPWSIGPFILIWLQWLGDNMSSNWKTTNVRQVQEMRKRVSDIYLCGSYFEDVISIVLYAMKPTSSCKSKSVKREWKSKPTSSVFDIQQIQNHKKNDMHTIDGFKLLVQDIHHFIAWQVKFNPFFHSMARS